MPASGDVIALVIPSLPMGGPVVQWVEQKSPCQTPSSHLASKISALNGVGEVVPSELRMRVKIL